MGFVLRCPNCGERNVNEFSNGGEYRKRPKDSATSNKWFEYIYDQNNDAGIVKEWWYHSYGCGKWFLSLRDRRNDFVSKTMWFVDK